MKTRTATPRLFKVFLSLVLACGLLPALSLEMLQPEAAYASALTSGDYEYRVYSGTVSIVGYNGSAQELTIPENMGGYVVTEIGVGAFEGCTALTKVNFPSTLKTISSNAFKGCSGLTTLTLPLNLSSVGGQAFYDCTSLSSIQVDSSSLSSMYNAFGNAGIGTNGITVTFSSTCKKVPESFASCSSSSIPNIKKVTLSSGVERIGKGAFELLSSLTSITLSDTLSEIGSSAFAGCSGLSEITFPSTLKTIRSYAFKGCSGLTSITLPENLSTLEYEAFEDCTALSSIRLDSRALSLNGSDVFKNAGGATDGIELTVGSSCLKVPDQFMYVSSSGNAPKLTNITMENGVKTIGSLAFENCINLKNVSFPDTLESIEKSAFNSCSDLGNVSFPSKLKTIGSYAFEDCTSITSVTLPVSLTDLGYGAFEDCLYLTTLTIRSNMIDAGYGSGAFRNAGGSTSGMEVTFSSNVTATTEYLFYTNSASDAAHVTKVTIPSSVTTVNESTFQGLTNYTIYGYDNTAAQTFATENDIPFVSLGDASSDPGDTGGDDGGDPADEGPSIRLSGMEADATSAAISAATYEQSDWVFLARMDDFADAMSATGLAGLFEAPIILTDRYSLSDSAAAEIERLGAKNVYIIGGWGAMPGDFESELAALGVTNVGRIYGTEYYDTSVECAKQIAKYGGSEDLERAIVAYGQNFQDALSISSFAYKYHVPILLETAGATSADRALPAEAVQLLSTGAFAEASIYVPGGNGAVSYDSVERVFGDKLRGGYRIYGEDGYDTSNALATHFIETGELSASTVCVATGAEAAKGVDALAGAALAGKAGGVMLLASAQPAMEADNYTTIDDGFDSQGNPSFLEENASSVANCYILGGSYVLPDAFKAKVDALLS